MEKKIPRSFFKFFPVERVDVLEGEQIRFSPIKDFNDPFEGMPIITDLTRSSLNLFNSDEWQKIEKRKILHYWGVNDIEVILKLKRIEEKDNCITLLENIRGQHSPFMKRLLGIQNNDELCVFQKKLKDDYIEIYNQEYKFLEQEYKKLYQKYDLNLVGEDQKREFSDKRFYQLQDYKDKFEKISEEYGILSLSASYDTSPNPSIIIGYEDDPRRNLLMWAHYADSHKGFVIEFDRNFFRDEADQVDYCEIRPQITYEEIDKSIQTEYLRSCLIKSKEWEYENEWRIFKKLEFADNKEFHLFNFDIKKIRSITFGCNMELNIKEEIKRIIRDKKLCQISIYEAKLDEKGFKLDFNHIILKEEGERSNDFSLTISRKLQLPPLPDLTS